MPISININAEDPEELSLWVRTLAAMCAAKPPEDIHIVNEPPQGDAPSASLAGSVDCSELDADGRPWDERIDSGNRAKKADGRWMRRRNLEDDYYNKILAELTGGAKADAPPSQEPIAAPSFGASVPAVPQGSIFGGGASAKTWTHDALTLELTNRVMAGTLGAQQVNLELSAQGAQSINDIPADKLAGFAAKFGL